MNATELSDLARIKQGARATWAAGDFPAVARLTLWEVGAADRGRSRGATW
jgi:hypothetical protein